MSSTKNRITLGLRSAAAALSGIRTEAARIEKTGSGYKVHTTAGDAIVAAAAMQATG